MIPKAISILGLLICIPVSLIGQSTYPVASNYNSIRQNGISAIEASGDTVWISPVMNYNIANSVDWLVPEGILNTLKDEGRVFSIAIDGPRIVAGLGSTPVINGESVVTGFGYYTSSDGGTSWNSVDFPLDEQAPGTCDDSTLPYNGSCDIAFTYGGESYFRIRNSVAQQSPPYSTSVYRNVILSAAWASGLLRSTDYGNSWERIILPPSEADSLSPDSSYSWPSVYNNTIINRYDARADLNLLGFSTMIDQAGNTWFGSGNGINISQNALSAPSDSIRWTHIQYDQNSGGLLANWVIDIEEDTATGRVWMTNWIIDSGQGEQFGLVSTDDQGQSFQQHLIGQKINDLAFSNGAVFAVGDQQVFISTDQGLNWNSVSRIESPNAFIQSNAQFYSAAASGDRVWIGTSDGLASTNDLGESWEITRVDFPLSGGNRYEPEAGTVQSYAYPNPFSPDVHDIVRIKFEVQTAGNVSIKVFDFGMNLVRDIQRGQLSSGTYETSWNGLDTKGRQVANGPYIYIVEMPDRTVNGKIVVIN